MTPGETDASSGGARRRLIPLALTLLFVGPLALAAFLYFASPGFRPHDTVNHGELIEPPLLLPAIAQASGPLLRDTWTIVHVDAGGCGEACRRALHDTRQVRTALGRDSERVRRLLLESGTGPLPADFAREHPDLVVVRAGPREADLLAAFPAPDGASARVAGDVYLVDPLGNLMMRYAPDAEPKGLLEDLERLLKLSHIG